MKVVLLTAGTRGDVQPFIALARGLAAAGHTVRLAAPGDAERLVAGQGIAYIPLRVDFQALVESDAGRAMLANPLRAVRYMRGILFPLFRNLLDDAWVAARGADVLIHHPKVLGGADIAARLGIPGFVAAAVPSLVPTREFPAPGIAARNLGGPLNRLSYRAVRSAERPLRGVLDHWRREALGLPPRRRADARPGSRRPPRPVLYAFSPHVVPPPADWSPAVHVTGFWFLDGPVNWSPPPGLLAFLEQGPPPVYIGFGSMIGRAPEQTTRLVTAAVAASGQRAVLATGWGGLRQAEASDSVFTIDAAPHTWLFPRVAAVVHHGGAGTTAEGLRAGKPTVVCPFFGDQPFWGKRVHALGAGPAPIPAQELSVERLARAIRAAVTDETMRERAVELGRKIRAEHGVERAVAVIGEAGGPPSPRTSPRARGGLRR